VIRPFIVLWQQLNLLTQAVVAVDGSEFQAVNNPGRTFTRAKGQRRMGQIEGSINRCMVALDIADQQEAETVQIKATKLKKKIAAIKKCMQQLKDLRFWSPVWWLH